MSVKFKILGGTAKGAEDLCTTCRHCSEINDSRFCGEIWDKGSNMRIKQRVYRCTSYDDKRLPTKQDLYGLAWVLRTTKGSAGRTVGFCSPKEFKKLVDKDEEDF